MTVHRAKEGFAELKSKHEALVEAAKSALAPAEKVQAEIVAAEKVVAAAAGVLKEKEAAAVKLRADYETARKALASAEGSLAAAEARAKAATEAAPANASEVPAAQAELTNLGGTGIPDYLSQPGTLQVGAYDMGFQMMAQLKAVLTTLIWSGVGSAIFFAVIKATMGLRVREDIEREGLDIAEHGEPAYNM